MCLDSYTEKQVSKILKIKRSGPIKVVAGNLVLFVVKIEFHYIFNYMLFTYLLFTHTGSMDLCKSSQRVKNKWLSFFFCEGQFHRSSAQPAEPAGLHAALHQ